MMELKIAGLYGKPYQVRLLSAEFEPNGSQFLLTEDMFTSGKCVYKLLRVRGKRGDNDAFVAVNCAAQSAESAAVEWAGL